jgi:hypothetical protein
MISLDCGPWGTVEALRWVRGEFVGLGSPISPPSIRVAVESHLHEIERCKELAYISHGLDDPSTCKAGAMQRVLLKQESLGVREADHYLFFFFEATLAGKLPVWASDRKAP